MFTNIFQVASGCETSWVKAGEMGRGPPYTRTRDERVSPQVVNVTRNGERAAMQQQQATDQGFVISTHQRIHYAIGILGVQDDLNNLDLK